MARGFIGAALLLALALAGCASPQRLTVGTPEAEVRATLGRPQAVHALADGQRLEYTLGPLQQTTYMVDLDRRGAVRSVRQVRTLDNFFRLKPGFDGTDSVRREFGAPWRVEHYPPSGLTAWLYPHLEAGSFNSVIAVHFDAKGVVHSVQNGPDPRFLGGGNRDD